MTKQEPSSIGERATPKTALTHVPCAYCRGTGKDRYQIMSPLSTCPVCHGRRSHELPSPLIPCAYCRGTGASPIGARNPCLACGGKGVQGRSPESAPCKACGGTGRQGSTGFYCHACHGSGRQD
ncbi:hypothetical protein JJD41_22180 [Oxynema sp. CENA135]|uniref:hypothetical protein n=1 Tax=Oxynema sp. CENA135 TaxID=984206 RepID=UPI00190C6E2B|nr:hypothetical protein [Oxynema sp. CENA135]MBK4732552.1 hypothetical protein [Oxynema sp. CENA135]